MSELADIKSVKETTETSTLNFWLENGGVLLASKGGSVTDCEGERAFIIYSVGFTVPASAVPQKERRRAEPISEAV